MQDIDVVVIGAGVAGLTAAMVAGRHGVKVAVIDRIGVGGQISTAERIENFPGFPQGVAGHELGPLLHEQAEAAGVEFMLDTVESIAPEGGRFLVRGGTYELCEGAARSRSVVVEFPSYQAALACYRSPEYQAAAALRKGKAEFDLLVIEGYDGPQP